MPFTSLGLADPLVRGILATGYTAPTEIQSKAIPVALTGRDIIGSAQTGTGKTAAFVLPMLNRLAQTAPAPGKRRPVRALIVTPTRELAAQIEASVRGYGRFMKMHTLSVYGGISMTTQIRTLQRGVDVVIATPGRLVDHLNRGSIDLSQVEVLVLDEADRMFDMGFVKDMQIIIGKTPASRQTLLFSATMSSQVKQLAANVQRNPKLIELSVGNNPARSINQRLYSVSKEGKIKLLLHMLEAEDSDCVLVFSRTKHGADRIRRKLDQANVRAVAIHSERTQGQRQQALEGFRAGRYRVLVATDIAARGIDVEGISHVVNFDVPTYAEDYVHRIGRTGRASLTGDAVTFVSRDEINFVRRIEQYIGNRMTLERYEGFVDDTPEPQPQAYNRHSSDSSHRRPDAGRSGGGKRPYGKSSSSSSSSGRPSSRRFGR